MALGKKFDVFLSYHSGDRPWVTRLKNALEAKGIKVWLDRDEIRPGDLFATALEKGIQESSSVAIIVSPQSMSSGWVNNEYHRALSLATNGQLQLIPVLYRQADIPSFLSDRNYVDFRDESQYDEQLQRLLWGITNQKPNTSPAPPEDELLYSVRAALQIVKQQNGVLSSRQSLYSDRSRMVFQQAERLDKYVRKIDSLMPASYNSYLEGTGLTNKVNLYKNDLSKFLAIGPTGDENLRSRLVSQLKSIHTLLESIARAASSA